MKYLVVVSDLHINSTVGLCDKTVMLDDGGSYTPPRSQKWLYDNWLDFWTFVDSLSGDSIITVLNGDMVDINKHAGHQLITPNVSVVLEHTISLLSLVKEISDRIYVVRGTAAHTGSSSQIEESLSRELQAVPSANSWSHWTLPIQVDGVLFDIAHHGKIGSTTWNRTAPLHTLAASITFNAVKNNVKIPDIVIRSHNHTHADTHDNLPVRVISTPAWQLSTEYSYRLGIVEMADIGGLIFACEDGHYELIKKLYKPQAKEVIVE